MTNLPERDPALTNQQQGVYRKFWVRRTDGSDLPGGKHEGCEYFVLDIDHDKFAPAALEAYADACEATHPELARDMRSRYELPRVVFPPVAWQARKGGQDWGPPGTNKKVFDQLAAEGYEVRALVVQL